MIPLAATKIDLASGWSTVSKALDTALGSGLSAMLTAVGVILVLGAVGKWVWERRKGGGGGGSAVIWTLIIGAVLAGPNVIIPGVLVMVDWIINIIVGLLPAAK